METRYYKGRDGWAGDTQVHLFDDRYLEVNTWKSPSGGLYSMASVHRKVQHDGYKTREFAIFGDYRRTLATDRTVRCTEKNVRAMHERALTDLDAIIAEAKAFYDAKKAA